MDQENKQVLIQLVEKSPVIGYEELHKVFGTDRDRVMENIIVDAIYEGVIVGQLDPKKRVLEVQDWQATVPTDLAFIKETLADWRDHCRGLLGTLENVSKQSNADAQALKDEEERMEKLIETKRDGMEFISRNVRHEERSARTYKRSKNVVGNGKRGH
ncbi:unnamed protein product [Bursaphelenchus okinawaensis]|uniref:PCI domain-containing protein n=1 Tax=Bursaphelenchus okinawaensis TaxID=465554 RepID=A0A811JU66_9BILA|nr:unnamed protein product [Bursaphelenchus okinawaensis]CAG9083204.1 unnamed protein product [Bursaphelenchus okinawaensis]